MTVTIPLGAHRSLIVACTRAGGLHAALWRASCGDLPVMGDDADGGVGVREPRRPVPGRGSGTVALPVDDVD